MNGLTKTQEEPVPAALQHEHDEVARAREEVLRRSAPQFELAALLRALKERGYGWDRISFEGVRSMMETPGLVHSLRFDGQAPRRAIVRLNAGLLSPNGALPSYFHQFAESISDPRSFLAFIRFFDNVLLKNDAFLTHPREGVAAGSALISAYRSRAGFSSVSRLHWLFRSAIPELEVNVRATSFPGACADDGARIGVGILGAGAIMGPVYNVIARGHTVRLYAEDERDEIGRSWEAVIGARVRDVIQPVLRGAGAHDVLEVRLCFERYRTAAKLESTAQIGVRRLPTRDDQGFEVVVVGPGAPPAAMARSA